MSPQNTFARSLHDVGLAAWFGGSLMGAVGLNGASGQPDDPRGRAAVANAGWARWTPVNAAAIGAHLLGGAQLVRANKGRLAVQPQARWVNASKTIATLVALGATGYSRWLGQQLMDADGTDAGTGAEGVRKGDADGEAPVDDAVTPLPSTPDPAAGAQRQLSVMQWVVPASTGILLALNAKAGEQQRPSAIVLDRVRAGVPLTLRAAPKALAAMPWRSLPWKAAAFAALGVLAAAQLSRRTRRRGRRARDIMTADVTTVGPQDTLETAARHMVEGNFGALPVRANGRVAGMVTDRDIVRHIVDSGADLSRVTVGEIATPSPTTVDVDDPLSEVVRTMAAGSVRRVPVVDHGELVGIISQADVAATGDDDLTGDLVEIISTVD